MFLLLGNKPSLSLVRLQGHQHTCSQSSQLERMRSLSVEVALLAPATPTASIARSSSARMVVEP